MNEKVSNILLWTGAIGAGISGIAYIIIMTVLVVGIESSMAQEQLLLVSILNAIAGLLITFMLRGQGVALASNSNENKKIMDEYRTILNKTKPVQKLRTITWFVGWKSFLDIFTKALTVAISTYAMIFIFMEGNGDISLVFLAIANVFLFISFGILALRGAYNFYNNDHISAIKSRIQILKDQVGSVPPEGVSNEDK